MPVTSLEPLVASKYQTLPLSTLKDATLGIEAEYYLWRLLHTQPSKEPLLSALGGFPYGLKQSIEDDLATFKAAGIKPLFVFNGLKIARTEAPFSSPDLGPASRLKAWDMYDRGLATRAVEAFGESDALQPEELYKYVQLILRENDAEFFVAPYSAWPQLSYFEKHPKQFVDAIFGNTELLLFDVEKVISSYNTTKSTFSWISKRYILSDLPVTSAHAMNNELFVDACLLAGSSLCSTFPPLEGAAQPLKAALELLYRYRTVANVVNAPQDNPALQKAIQSTKYLDKYYRARAAVKHHVIMTDDGKVEPLDVAEAPSDVHEFIGQRFPEELYFYLSRGVIGPQVLNMLASGEVIEVAPLDGGDSDEYHKFLESLHPIRTQALSLLAQPQHRFWQYKEISVHYWFDPEKPRKLAHKEVQPTPYEIINQWHVKESIFRPELEKSKSKKVGLSFAVSSLVDAKFAALTKKSKKDTELLKTKDEITLNTLYRTIQLRGFASEDHTLTPWGRALAAALGALDPKDNLEESVFAGLELLRLRFLKGDNFTTYLAGAPQRGTDEDRRHTLLISRIALLAPINHRAIGYTGPLSRNLLAFNAFTKNMTRALRNIVEMVLVSMLMNDDVDKADRSDWPDLGLSLPFIDEANAGLGIAVKTYLDELANDPDPTSQEAKDEQKRKLPEMFVQAYDINADVAKAFRLWDAIVVGIKAVQSDNIVPDAQKFLDADTWLVSRR